MANTHNFWCGISQAFQDELVGVVRDDVPAVTYPMLNELEAETYELFATIYDSGAMERLFRTWHAKSYRCWNCYTTKPDNVGKVRADLDALATEYPTDFSILGAWHYGDGRPIGMRWDESDPPQLVDDPWYPQPAETIEFMPDIVVDDTDPENPVMGRPTELSNVLLCFGQPPRVFTPAA